MAGFSPKDCQSVQNQTEEETLKHIIAEAWDLVRKVNWNDRKYCIYRSSKRVHYPVARSFQTFFNNEGWEVVFREEPQNMLFTIYLPEQ